MRRPRSTHFALATSEFEPMLKRLRGAGVRYEALSGVAHEVSVRFDGVRQVYFQDPDGHWIESNDAPPVPSAH